jgi:uncharacterized SAM-binding protein YcdF (DUF218 family)
MEHPRQLAASRPHALWITVPVLCFLVLMIAFLRIGHWLFVEDPIDHAQAIAVLSGRVPIRAIEAARLYREGYAPQVWLTHPSEPTASLAAIGIDFGGEDLLNTQVLTHQGVPLAAIHVIPPPIANTADEIRAISEELARQHGAAVIIVTSKVHTRRTRALWRKLSQNSGIAVVRAASGDPFDPAHWWRTSGDALDVVRELLGLLNLSAGLPLRAAG